MKYLVVQEGEEHDVEVRELDDGRFEVTAFGQTVIVEATAPQPGMLTLMSEGEIFDVAFEGLEKPVWGVRARGRTAQLEVLDLRTAYKRQLAAADGPTGAWDVTAPMPGKVTSVLVAPDQEVRAGQGLLVIEAMKMENELRAPAAGRISGVHTQAGATVESGARLISGRSS